MTHPQIFLTTLLVLRCANLQAASGNKDVTRFVDPFIGTANGGNTYPGAVHPWGMVSVSPHTDLRCPSGYVHGNPWFYGLGQVHLSGTGCTDLGSVIITASTGTISTEPENYKCMLTDQVAAPGYWAGTLVEPSLRAEATATVRSGVMRFTPLRKGKFTILADAGRSLGLLGGGAVRWVSLHELEGYNIGGGFCGESNRHTVYFAAVTSRGATERGVWHDNLISAEASASGMNTSIGAWARFDGDPVEVRVGISYVSIANARANLAAEAANRTFDELRAEARDAWESMLSRIQIPDGNEADLTKFYTALYHAMIHPGILSDVNGEYPLYGRPGSATNRLRERYSVFSLWDTYRTLHPLLTLLYPERQSAIVNTMIDMYRESGWLPKWELAGNETHMMVGDGAVIVIADTYTKGVRDFDTATAYQAMRKPGATPGPEAEPSRPGYADYLRLGYIPSDQDTSKEWWVWGPVSTTLEYCLSDWAFAQAAAAMGHPEVAAEYSRRAQAYSHLFDPETRFLRPRRSDGSWLVPFNPTQTEGSGNWAGSGGPGYVEGNAWTYTWFVPHDVERLAALFGGTDLCAAKLDSCFTSRQFTINNEPDFAYPYLFTYLPGHEARTRELAHEIMQKKFGTGPGGLPGNDDAGTLSAWFVFSALGFYPACPGSGEYRLGAPLFERATIRLNRRYYSGEKISIVLRDDRMGQEGMHAVEWNGAPLNQFRIGHDTLTSGGELAFPARK